MLVPGKANVLPDFLSRFPMSQEVQVREVSPEKEIDEAAWNSVHCGHTEMAGMRYRTKS